MSVTYTPNFNLSKYEAGDHNWNTGINSNFDTLDTVLFVEHNADGTHKITVSGTGYFDYIYGSPNVTISGTSVSIYGSLFSVYTMALFEENAYFNEDVYLGSTVLTESYLSTLTAGSDASSLHNHDSSYIFRDGDTLGVVSGADTSTNRFRFNMPISYTPDDHAAMQFGGEYDGSITTIGLGAGNFSSQVFVQARNDGSASSYYSGLWARADSGRNSSEIIALGLEALGPNAYGLYCHGGTSGQSIAYGGYWYCYASSAGVYIKNLGSGPGIKIETISATNPAAYLQNSSGRVLSLYSTGAATADTLYISNVGSGHDVLFDNGGNNPYIDSSSGKLDIVADDIVASGTFDATEYKVAGLSGIDASSITISGSDGTTHHFVFDKGICTSYYTT